MNITLDMLNVSQRQAVEWRNGPLLVLAGPGSGKTAVLTLRIANLIKSSPEESFRILGLTFTVKAANEMQDRIKEIIGEDNKRIQLRTFHSFCTDLLRQHGSHLGLRPDFSVITDEKDRIAILREIHSEGIIEMNDPEDFLAKINIMFTHGIGAEDLPLYFNPGQESNCQTLQAVFRGYIDRLLHDNQLDFGSMLHFSRELLTTKPRVAKQVKTVYRYICVDEFQDTNLAQYNILKLLAKDINANLFVVADDDQIIFQWNGADPKRLQELKDDYKLKIVQLPENFRCPAEIVEIANKLIENNPDRISSKNVGVSHKNGEGVIEIAQFKDFISEVNGLISKIKSIPKNQRDTCLVIARSNKLLSKIKEEMNATGIAAEIVSKHQDFASPLVQIMYYSLKLVNAPASRSILNKLCSVATLVNGITLSAEDVAAKSKVEGLTLLRAFFILAATSDILNVFAKRGEKLLCDSLNYKSFVDESYYIFDQLNKNEGTDSLYPDYYDDKMNWERIATNIYRTRGENVSLYEFIQEMDLSPKSKPLSKDCTRLQTVHTSKGVEFANVFVVGLAEDQFPTYFAIKNGDTAIQEERRNCFVAITRSSKYLYLSYARQYFGWSKQPSRFLKEMGLVSG